MLFLEIFVLLRRINFPNIEQQHLHTINVLISNEHWQLIKNYVCMALLSEQHVY